MQIGEGVEVLSLPSVRLLLPRPDPTAGLPPAPTAPMLPGMAWWIWALAATNAWFGVSVAIGELWAALHRSACRQSHSREAVGMAKRKQSPRGQPAANLVLQKPRARKKQAGLVSF